MADAALVCFVAANAFLESMRPTTGSPMVVASSNGSGDSVLLVSTGLVGVGGTGTGAAGQNSTALTLALLWRGVVGFPPATGVTEPIGLVAAVELLEPMG